jgi:DNA polymerase-3 subunit epsilon
MFTWLKNLKKDYPDFWKTYLSKFEKKSTRYVILNVETSGHDQEKDVILSISTFAIIDNTILINDSFETVLLQYIFNHDNGISNAYIILSDKLKLTEYQAMEQLVGHIQNAVLVGFRINFAIDMINSVLEKMHCGKLRNEALDIEIMFQKWKDDHEHSFSLEEMSTYFKIPKNNDIDSCTGNAYTTALLFLKIKSRLGIY